MNSNKKRILENVLFKGCFDILNSNNSKQLGETLWECAEYYSIFTSYRYLSPRSWSVPKSIEWYFKILPSYDDIRFKACLRVNRSQFSDILCRVLESKSFKAHTFKISVEKQLAIALYRFGNDGSGVSFKRIGHIFGISDAGAIRNCTDRVIKALLSLQNSIISWPDADERNEICQSMAVTLPGCIGYVDGCHIPLFQAPLQDHEAYYSRKQQYAMHLQGICDNSLIFRDISVGYPASAHDARVFANTPIGQTPQNFLSQGQWLAGDSAYRLTEYVVTPFRENSNGQNSRQRRRFNRYFSSHRVKIEHAFGILKNKFGSLRSLRIRVDKVNGHRRACEWIAACVVLHNIIKPADELYDIENDEIENCENNFNANVDDNAQRDNLFNWFVTNMD